LAPRGSPPCGPRAPVFSIAPLRPLLPVGPVAPRNPVLPTGPRSPVFPTSPFRPWDRLDLEDREDLEDWAVQECLASRARAWSSPTRQCNSRRGFTRKSMGHGPSLPLTNLFPTNALCSASRSTTLAFSRIFFPMPHQPCPVCRRDAPRWLESSSKEASVNYYRCDECGSVWTVPKTDPAALPQLITKAAESN
jgi:hypothetical protein